GCQEKKRENWSFRVEAELTVCCLIGSYEAITCPPPASHLIASNLALSVLPSLSSSSSASPASCHNSWSTVPLLFSLSISTRSSPRATLSILWFSCALRPRYSPRLPTSLSYHLSLT